MNSKTIILAICSITIAIFAGTSLRKQNREKKVQEESEYTLKMGDVLVVDDRIRFDFNSHTIQAVSHSYLDSLAILFQNHPHLIIEVGVHNDTRGPKNTSRKLSQRRAEEITTYLIHKGCEFGRVVGIGYEGLQPIISDEQIAQMQSEEQKEKAHARNRRVEFKVLRTLPSD